MAESALRLEYLGFSNTGMSREFAFRIHPTGAGPFRNVIVVITDAAFSGGHARYQDGPDICYQTLLKKAVSLEPGVERLVLSDEDLYNYRHAHAPKAPRRRSPAVTPSSEPSETEPIRDVNPWRP